MALAASLATYWRIGRADSFYYFRLPWSGAKDQQLYNTKRAGLEKGCVNISSLPSVFLHLSLSLSHCSSLFICSLFESEPLPSLSLTHWCMCERSSSRGSGNPHTKASPHAYTDTTYLHRDYNGPLAVLRLSHYD